MEGLYMGLNGTIYACVGIQLAASILHCAQLRAKYGMQFYITLFFSVMLVVTSMGFTDSPIIQFFGFAFGFLFGLAFHPRMPNANVPQNADKLLKIFAFVLPGIAFILGIII